MLRIYAQVLSLVLVLVGVVGLFLGERLWLGVLNVDLLEDVFHLITAGLLAFVGFSEWGRRYLPGVVGAVGASYLIVGVVGFLAPTMFGLLPHGYSIVDNILHLALGVLSLAFAFYPRLGTTVRWRGTGATPS